MNLFQLSWTKYLNFYFQNINGMTIWGLPPHDVLYIMREFISSSYFFSTSVVEGIPVLVILNPVTLKMCSKAASVKSKQSSSTPSQWVKGLLISAGYILM
jgi:hypothetical protein